MEVGNIVEPTKESGFILHCGTGTYKDAVVISSEPFILTSRESDMKWQATIKKEDFEITGNIDEKALKNCMRRL